MKIDRSTLFFALLAAVCAGLLGYRDGLDRVAQVVQEAGALLLGLLPLVVLAVTVAAYVQQLLPMDVARRWLGEKSGLRSLLLMTVAGALTPGGPFSAFPLVVAVWRAGASLPACVTYLTAWGVLGVQRAVVWDLPFFGAEFTGLRLLVSLPLPLLAGLLVQMPLSRKRVRT